MIKQCKGKDLNKVPKSRLLEGPYLVSIKYDGQYIQIHKLGDTVKFFTSGGKEFYLDTIAKYLIDNNKGKDFILEAEFIGTDVGKLGGRTKCGMLTTWRTEFSKGIRSLYDNSVFKVFDIIDTELPFLARYKKLGNLNLPSNLQRVSMEAMSLDDALTKVKSVVKDGYEGLYLKHIDHIYYPGKRVNDAIKLKRRPTADLLCIGYDEGLGKYEGLIGSLVLKDKKGRIVKVGSGLDDSMRAKDPAEFISKVIEVEYEQILDTYIQPTFIRIRNDKTKEDID